MASGEYLLPYVIETPLLVGATPKGTSPKNPNNLARCSLTHPFSPQPPGQHSIDANLGALRARQAPHEMQLRGLGHAVRHGTPARVAPRNAGRHDEDAALGVGGEGGQRFFEEEGLRLDVHREARVPV